MQIRFDDSQVQAAFAKFPVAMQAAARAAVTEALGELEREVVQRVPVAHGILAGKVFSALRGEETDAVRGEVAVAPPADRYALPVETGTRPHFPPLDAILLWLEAPKMKAVVLSMVQQIQSNRKRGDVRGQKIRARIAKQERKLAALDPDSAEFGIVQGRIRKNERRIGRLASNDVERAKRSLAFLIGRKIARQGTKGAFMFRDAFAENEERVVAHIRGRLEAAAVEVLS